MSSLVLAFNYIRDCMEHRVYTPAMRGVRLAIAPARPVAVLAAAAGGLLLLGIAVSVLQIGFGRDHLLGLAPLLNLNGEHNLPTWFSSVLLVFAAASAAAAGVAGPRPDRHRWLALGAVFLLLSIDEASALHELSNAPLRAALGAGGVLYFPWVLVGLSVAAAVAVAEWRLLRRLPLATAAGIVAAGGCYVLGAVGMELLAAPLYAAGEKLTLPHAALVAAEEGLEMAGIILFIAVVLRYAGSQAGAVIAVDDRAPLAVPPPAVRVAPRRVLAGALAVVVTLAAVSLAVQLWVYTSGDPAAVPLARVVDLARPGNLPTWWQATLLLACAGMAAAIAQAEGKGNAGAGRSWTALAVVFVCLSMDEGAGIHELAVPWIAIGAALSLAAALASRRLASSLPAPTRRTLGLAAVAFVAGALGVEAMSGAMADNAGLAGVRHAAITTVAELLQMLGVLLALKALLEHLRDHVGTVTLGAGRTP